MNRNGILVVLSGFSGSGKGTLMKSLLETYDNYALSISATTRTPRVGEEDGVAYFFKSREVFQEMIRADAFIEYACYVDNFYGTPKAYVEEKLQAGYDVILEIEMQGALKVKEKFPETLLIFVTPPTIKELERRLTERGTESMEVIAARMAQAREEAKYMEQYDHILVNERGCLEECRDELHRVIQSAHTKTSQNLAFIAEIKKQLTVY